MSHYLYKIVDISNRLIYIGETKNIAVRAHTHEHLTSEYRLFFCPVKNIEIGKRVEKVLIYLFTPVKNKSIPKLNPLFPEGFTFDDVKWHEYSGDLLAKVFSQTC